MAKFWGFYVNEHYEKKLKDFKPCDWIVMFFGFVPFLVCFLLAITINLGFILVGLAAPLIWAPIAILIIFHKFSKLTVPFELIGVILLIGGGLWILGGGGYAAVYAFFMLGIIWFALGIFFIILGINKALKRKRYSLKVNATCEIVDVRKINIGNMGDGPNDNLINTRETVVKPGFHYYVNSEEYFTTSDIYYGSGNKEFREGNRVELNVNPNNPSQILPKSATDSMEMIFGIISTLGGAATGIVVTILFFAGAFDKIIYGYF